MSAHCSLFEARRAHALEWLATHPLQEKIRLYQQLRTPKTEIARKLGETIARVNRCIELREHMLATLRDSPP